MMPGRPDAILRFEVGPHVSGCAAQPLAAPLPGLPYPLTMLSSVLRILSTFLGAR